MKKWCLITQTQLKVPFLGEVPLPHLSESPQVNQLGGGTGTFSLFLRCAKSQTGESKVILFVWGRNLCPELRGQRQFLTGARRDGQRSNGYSAVGSRYSQTLIPGGMTSPFTGTETTGRVKSVWERRWVLEHHSASRSSEEACVELTIGRKAAEAQSTAHAAARRWAGGQGGTQLRTEGQTSQSQSQGYLKWVRPYRQLELSLNLNFQPPELFIDRARAPAAWVLFCFGNTM